MQTPLRTARLVELLVYPHFIEENPPQSKLNAWIRAAKNLPEDGLFIIISTSRPDNIRKARNFIEGRVKQQLGDRCILVCDGDLTGLKGRVSRAGFQISKETKLYSFGMHTFWCPVDMAEKTTRRILGIKDINSIHLRNLSVLSAENKKLYKRLLKEKGPRNAYGLLHREVLRDKYKADITKIYRKKILDLARTKPK